MNTNKPGLTPLDALNLPEALLALCRERQIVTAEQARDLVEMLLQNPDRGDRNTHELNSWFLFSTHIKGRTLPLFHMPLLEFMKGISIGLIM